MLFFGSCKSDPDLSPSLDNKTQNLGTVNGLYGKWKLYSLDNGSELPYNVWLEIKSERNEKGLNIINGKSFINFFNASFTWDASNKGFKVYDLINTEIAGSKKEQDLETEFFKRFLDTKLYEINTKGELIFKISTASKQNMIFKPSN